MALSKSILIIQRTSHIMMVQKDKESFVIDRKKNSIYEGECENMKRQIKITAFTAATLLLALGASFSAMAAESGTWRFENGEWYCYNKNGDAYEDEFCLSNGREFYVGEDGRMVRSSWVEHEGYWYYVNSGGEKMVNQWRYTVPAEDEDAEEEWYYLQASGKRVEGKKMAINGETYYFDSDGVMLTGWVQGEDGSWENADNDDVDGHATYYCNEDGARVSSSWVYTYAPGLDEYEAEEEEQNWYYILSGGRPAVGRQNSIKGHTYFFGTDGAMLSGWVAGSGDVYEEIWKEDAAGTAHSEAVASGKDIYFCGSADDGHAKKNRWVKTWGSEDYGYGDYDTERRWFYLQNNGKLFVPATSANAEIKQAQEFDLVDVSAPLDRRFESDGIYGAQEKKINNETYLFNEEGEMMYGFVKMGGNMYYYGDKNDGARKSGSLTVTDENGENTKAHFSKETDAALGYYAGAGVNGAKSGKLYADGILVKAQDSKYEIKQVGDLRFVVNNTGSIQADKGPYKYDGETLFKGAVFTYNTANKGASYESIATMN